MGYHGTSTQRHAIPTVVVRLGTDDGEVIFRARWRGAPIELQRRILYRLREGQPLWFEDEWGRDLCFRPEAVWAALVDGRKVFGPIA